MIVIVMGVAGAGKTTVGRRVAVELGAEFHDADDFHSPEAMAKMQSGRPLGDADRGPWLDRLAALIGRIARERGAAVLACSALKEAYRDRLRSAAVGSGESIQFVYLCVTPAVAEHRVRERPGHYMPATLIESQFVALEEPTDAVVIDASQPVEAVIRDVRAAIATAP